MHLLTNKMREMEAGSFVNTMRAWASGRVCFVLLSLCLPFYLGCASKRPKGVQLKVAAVAGSGRGPTL